MMVPCRSECLLCKFNDTLVNELDDARAPLQKYGLTDPALHDLAVIVRGADTDRLDLAPQSAGLLAISLGLSRLYPNDEALLPRGFLLYDALYEWLQHAKSERHSWNPQRVPNPA